MHDSFVPKTSVQITAFFWGIACFLPVGMAYVAAFCMMAAMLISGVTERSQVASRWKQFRQHLVFWPLCGFLAWNLLILFLQPTYPETPSNLFHVFRIALTLALVLMLRDQELFSALVGWIAGSLLALLLIYTNLLIALPDIPGLRNLLKMDGNKSIGISVLLALFASCAFIYAFKRTDRWLPKMAWLGLLLVVPVLIWLLPSRTSLLLIFVALGVGSVHRLLNKPALLMSAIVLLAALGLMLSQVPQVQQRFAQGIEELQASQKADQAPTAEQHTRSWGMRYLLYTQTIDMVTEKPFFGWGIGSWNDQWRKRTPAFAHPMNMPHNDFLWVGAQSGIPGMLALAAIMFALILSVFRIRSYAATYSLVTTSGLLVAMSLNSALRDAQIGMSVLFVVAAANAWAIASDKRQNAPSA